MFTHVWYYDVWVGPGKCRMTFLPSNSLLLFPSRLLLLSFTYGLGPLVERAICFDPITGSLLGLDWYWVFTNTWAILHNNMLFGPTHGPCYWPLHRLTPNVYLVSHWDLRLNPWVVGLGICGPKQFWVSYGPN